MPLSGSHGFRDASCDLAVVERMWDNCPDANLGLVCGVRFDVLDIDYDGAEESDGLLSLPSDLGDDEAVYGPTVLTGRGGYHLYIAPQGIGTRVGFLPYVEWRAKGSYVVAPPSVHPNGNRYSWPYPVEFGPTAPIRPAPTWLTDLLDRRTGPNLGHYQERGIPRSDGADTYGKAALESELGRLALTPVGQRNDALCRSSFRAGQLVAAGRLDVSEAIDAVAAVAARVGLDEREIAATIDSCLGAGMNALRR
jgi:hypothetical protein